MRASRPKTATCCISGARRIDAHASGSLQASTDARLAATDKVKGWEDESRDKLAKSAGDLGRCC